MKHLGLLIILVFWVTAIVLVKKWPNNSSFTMSRHAASHKKAYLMMALSETAYLPLFSWFIVAWFVKNTGVSPWLGYINILVSAGFLGAAWIPHTHGWKAKVHIWLAYSAALLMIPLMAILTFSPSLSLVTRIIAGAGCLYMVVSPATYFSPKATHKYDLYLQGLYFLLAHLAILSAIYVG